MESALIAGLAGLLGLALGRLWDRRSESNRWRRDQRVHSYENLAYTYYRLRDQCRQLSAKVPGTEESDRAVDRVLDTGVEWQRDVVAVWFHGSEPVTEAVKELDDQANELFLSARDKQFTWDEWRVRRVVAEQALEQFILAIRREFALPEFPVKLRWRREKNEDRPSDP
jgi:hypothetical protein